MKLVETNKTFERYILESKFSGMKFEILYYTEREFVSFWIVPNAKNSVGNNWKLLTKEDILKEAESSAKSGYLNREEGTKVKNTLLSIAEKF